MKKTLLITAPLLLTTFVSVSSIYWWQHQISPVNPSDKKTITVSVSSGQPANTTVEDLLSKGLIHSALSAKIYIKIFRMDQQFKPGIYQLSPSQPVSSLFNDLSAGPKDIWVTFPEGWRREQIAARLKSTLGPASAFDPQAFIGLTASLEGRLFPDTYAFPVHTTAADAVRQMTDNFFQKTGLGSTPSATLILASMVEREAKSDADRQIIASILKKRYLADWPLQIDATVQYSKDSYDCRSQLLTCKWWEPIYDTKFPSVFNTYLHPGLPPAPICNPGLASIQAVQNARDTPYWYYLTDDRGITHFAKTITEHNLNVDKYLHP